MLHQHTYIQTHPPLLTGWYLRINEAVQLKLPNASSTPARTWAFAEERGHCTGCGGKVVRDVYLDRDRFKLYRRAAA